MAGPREVDREWRAQQMPKAPAVKDADTREAARELGADREMDDSVDRVVRELGRAKSDKAENS